MIIGLYVKLKYLAMLDRFFVLIIAVGGVGGGGEVYLCQAALNLQMSWMSWGCAIYSLDGLTHQRSH